VARELETGTFRLAWTQVTRTRWIVAKLSLLGLVSMVVAGVLSLMVTWWASPLDRVRMTPFTSFEQRGLVPIGYAAFAFVLGVTAGAVTRRTLPSMAAVLGVFVAARLVVAHWVRPHLVAPLHISIPHTTFAQPSSTSASAGGLDPRDWIISDNTINAKAHVIGQYGSVSSSGNAAASEGAHGLTIPGVGSCPDLHSTTAQSIQQCVNHMGVREVVTYQPITHYWALQWTELAVFLGAAVALSGLCIWWVRKRLP
jgi:hypothetical protein